MSEWSQIERETLSLLDSLAPQLLAGANLRKSWQLKGGISAITTAFEISNGIDSLTCVLRQTGPRVMSQNPGAAKKDFLVYKELFEHGISVPEPLLLDQYGLWFVMAFSNAKPNLNPADPVKHIEQMATHLASIHKTKVNPELMEVLPIQNLEFSQRKPQTETGQKIYDAMHNRMPNSTQKCLVHGDYWPGNILWNQDSIAAIVDWEEAAYGAPLFDLGIARLDVFWAFGEAALNHFTDSYFSSNPIDTTDLPLWDLRACYRCDGLFAEFAPAYPHFGRPDITADHLQNLQTQFAFRALEEYS